MKHNTSEVGAMIYCHPRVSPNTVYIFELDHTQMYDSKTEMIPIIGTVVVLSVGVKDNMSLRPTSSLEVLPHLFWEECHEYDQNEIALIVNDWMNYEVDLEYTAHAISEALDNLPLV